MKKIYPSFVFIIVFFYTLHCRASQDTLKTGSFIVNMGVTPQTIANGLKPYGLVYDLVKNHKVPVKWVINTGKSKDGIDFTHNGVDYRGGTFIIPFEYRTSDINTVISSWQAQGVIGSTSVSDLVLDVIKTIYYAPNWTMDKLNGMIVTNYFANAGIPSTAYGGDSSNWKTPAQLGACDDIFVMPHADPTWSTHNNLYYWNKDHKGNIWAACHAVSELENITDPSNTIQLNFLSTTGLVHWKDHKKTSPPYLYADHGNPVMQFMQTLDEATNIGSEKIYLPKSGSTWRSSTTLGVYDLSNENIPSLSDGPAAAVAYGRAYGDASRGYVMYEAGHDHNSNGTEAEKVAAQRAFFNYSFFVAVDRYAELNTKINGLPDILIPNQPYPLSFSVPAGIDLSNYTIQWTSSCGGTFTTINSQSVTFTPPTGNGACIVSVSLTDGCGREVFSSEGAYIGGVLSVAPVALRGQYNESAQSVQLNWTDANVSNTDHYEIQRSTNGVEFKTVALFFPDQQPKTNTGFSYKDKYAVERTATYRLKIHTVAKTIVLSNMVKLLSADAKSQLSLLSNPVKTNIAFEYQSPVAGTISTRLFDMTGKLMGQKNMPVQKGMNAIQMDVQSAWPAGTYVLQVTTPGSSITQKVNLVK